MTEIKQGDTVRIHYTGTLRDGNVFRQLGRTRSAWSSPWGPARSFPVWTAAHAGYVEIGEKKRVEVDCQLMPMGRSIPLCARTSRAKASRTTSRWTPVPSCRCRPPMARRCLLSVVDANEETVTLDANHPLAGPGSDLRHRGRFDQLIIASAITLAGLVVPPINDINRLAKLRLGIEDPRIPAADVVRVSNSVRARLLSTPVLRRESEIRTRIGRDYPV